MNASIEVAIQLEDLFNEPFSSPVDVLDGAGEVRDADPTPRRPRPTPTTSTSSTCSRTRIHGPPDRPGAVQGRLGGRGELPARVLTGHSTFTPAAEKRARIMSSSAR